MTERTGEIISLDVLPEKPEGWTRGLSMHLNFGGGKGAATYDIYDEQGRKVEGIGFGYDTRQGGGRGFLLHRDHEIRYLTWAQLREAYTKGPNRPPDHDQETA